MWINKDSNLEFYVFMKHENVFPLTFNVVNSEYISSQKCYVYEHFIFLSKKHYKTSIVWIS